MGFSDIFKGKQYKAELESLQQQHNDLQRLMTPELRDAFSLQNKMRELEHSIQDQEHTVSALNNTISSKEEEIKKLNCIISSKKSEIIAIDDEITVQEFGLYKPQFDFANALGYKEKLFGIRAEQKSMIKDKTAVLGATNWQVNGDRKSVV